MQSNVALVAPLRVALVNLSIDSDERWKSRPQERLSGQLDFQSEQQSFHLEKNIELFDESCEWR